jgi:outer membrane lipoprotein-sorting protein
MAKRQFSAQNFPRSFAMTFANHFARALVPTAMLAAAIPASAAESPDMARLATHIHAVRSMTASFTQTDARGRSAAGTLQLKRPGKVRFAYGSGDLLLVSNGKTLTFIDYQVGQKSSWPLVFLRSGAAPGGLQLYGWTAIDAQNKRTTVKLSNVRYNVAVPETAFSYAEPKSKGR